jgi:hypothetical protein
MATIRGAGGAGKFRYEKVLAEIVEDISKPGSVRVGFLEGATAPNGDSIPLRAALNEFGHGNTPPRPFFRNMIHDKSPSWPAAVALNLRLTNFDVDLTLARVGEGIAAQLATSILDLWTPALAPSTVKKKGFDKPLIEHGDMINAIGYQVTGRGQTLPFKGKWGAASAKALVKPKP